MNISLNALASGSAPTERQSTSRRALPLVFALSLAALLPACGSSGADDPLTGSWSNTSCFGSSTIPADVDKCTTTLTFTTGLDIELRAEWFSKPATATNPGCTTTRQVVGQQWSTDSTTFTVTGSGTSTVERTKCVNETDNMAPVPTTDIAIPSGGTRYEISNGTLSILSGDLSGSYAK
jgi:hypothetical protein